MLTDLTELHVVVGLGLTGQSCVRFLSSQQIPVVAMDTRSQPPGLEKFRQQYPQIPLYTGNLLESLLQQAKRIIVSPGISLQTPELARAQAAGIEIIGDIELFTRYNQAPLIAITGANGKSTVTSLVGAMAASSGKNAVIAGNIGTPVLDLLAEKKQLDLAVLELSSFQLETTSHLAPLAATVLNITPDHMDRYATFNDYVLAKHRIYIQTQNAIINKQDPLSDSPNIPADAQRIYFTLATPAPGEFGLRQQGDQTWLAYGKDLLLPANALKIVGQHNLANALSALALGTAAGLAMEPMLEALKTFSGLAHRCQWVAENNHIIWINDSKGTNIGACQAALSGLGAQLPGKIVLLLGGDGKGADFTELAPLIKQYCRAIIAMGKDGYRILSTLGNLVLSQFAQTMDEAVALANEYAQQGDVVLLSPACASLDQYRDFAHRGEVFMQAVKTALKEKDE